MRLAQSVCFATGICLHTEPAHPQFYDFRIYHWHTDYQNEIK